MGRTWARGFRARQAVWGELQHEMYCMRVIDCVLACTYTYATAYDEKPWIAALLYIHGTDRDGMVNAVAWILTNGAKTLVDERDWVSWRGPRRQWLSVHVCR